MQLNPCAIVVVLYVASCIAQDIPRPTFPDVFQTEIEGTFITGNAVVEIDVSMFYDRTNNRAALFVTKEGELSKTIYNFDSDERISIDGNECDVQDIPEGQGFFPFTTVDGKKKMSSAEETFYFTKSELDTQVVSDDKTIPTLIYKANINIPQYGKINCDLTHIFSKPDLERPTCQEGIYCNSTLMSIAVECKDENNVIDVDHVYRFSRFRSQIADESVFLIPPGVHCEVKSPKTLPKFPPYFSFTFDVIERPKDAQDDTAIFNTHKELWYDADYKIIRIDEFGRNGLLYSSRIFDLKAGASFTIIASVPTCEIASVSKDLKFYDVTRLPKAFFSSEASVSDKAVYVGKRKVHGLDYEVWSLTWKDAESEAKIVEDIYFLQITSNNALSEDKETYLQISHVDMYVYEAKGDASEYDLTLLKYFSVNNFRSAPKEWVAFDVATCFQNKQKIEFVMKLEGAKLMKESQSYKKVLQLLYERILSMTDISIVRISELTGIFDGVQLLGVRGSVINNSELSGWPSNSIERSMEETFEMIKTAVSEKKLSFIFKGENNMKGNGCHLKFATLCASEFTRLDTNVSAECARLRMPQMLKIITVLINALLITMGYSFRNFKKYFIWYCERKINVTSVKALQVTSDDYPKPSLPDVLQTEIEGSFTEENTVSTVHASMYYDKPNNRAALYMTKEGSQKMFIYDFDSGETISIDGNDCQVQEITQDQLFFPFFVNNNNKQMFSGEEAFYFSKSILDKQLFPDSSIPTLKYTANLNISQYGDINCDVTHVFSKPDLEPSVCSGGLYCTPTLMSMALKCRGENREVLVDNIYRFSSFKTQIDDDSVFQVPPGVHCNRKNSKPFPSLPHYFSFTFDIIEEPKDSRNDSAMFTTHKEVWYDADYKIIRIDEFDYNGLLYSSRIFDLKAKAAFTIIASIPTCDIGPATNDIKFDEVTRLPRALFYQNDSSAQKAAYVGKRKVHGLDYEVWSLLWDFQESETKIIEEIYFVEAISNQELSNNITERDMYLQISHVDMYTYEKNQDWNKYDLTLLKYFSINNYRTKPKEWSAFDVDTCFTNKYKQEFVMKAEGPNLVKGSQFYREVLEQLYNKIIAVTGVSIVRISELKGIFDGVELTEIRGLILDNSESSGWPKNSKEPGMKETFNLIKKAASENELSVTIHGENNIELKINVTYVEMVKIQHPKKDCFSGSSLAAAGLVLLLIGVAFGVAGYYVFLKKRRASNVLIRMSDIEPEKD